MYAGGDERSSELISTLCSIKVIHLHGFTPEELEAYRQQIFRNICEAMQVCLELMLELGIPLEDESNLVSRSGRRGAFAHGRSLNLHSPTPQRHGLMLDQSPDLRDKEVYPPKYLESMRVLWEDAGVQSCVQRGKEASLPEKIGRAHV